MRSLILILVLIASPVYTYAEDPAENNVDEVAEAKKLIKDTLIESFDVNTNVIDSEALNAVFNVTFYKTITTIKYSLGATGTSVSQLFIRNKKMYRIPVNNTGKEMPELRAIIQDSFALNSMENAQIFEEALNILYPASRNKAKDSAETITHKRNLWVFSREDHLDDKMSFVVTVDDKGNIQKIRYEPYP